jgi:hypothetical protein
MPKDMGKAVYKPKPQGKYPKGKPGGTATKSASGGKRGAKR